MPQMRRHHPDVKCRLFPLKANRNMTVSSYILKRLQMLSVKISHICMQNALKRKCLPVCAAVVNINLEINKWMNEWMNE